VHSSLLIAEPSKTEVIRFGSSADLDRLDRLADTDVTICLDQATIHPSDCVRDLRVLLDSSLAMRQHIAKVASTCFFHFRRLRRLRRVLDLKNRKRSVRAFVLTRTDYCNAVLVNLPDSALAPLQRVLHAAARFVADLGPRDHVTSTLVSLHWLPICQRITYELCTMMHSVYYALAPVCISDIVTSVTHLPGRAHALTISEKWRQQYSRCTFFLVLVSVRSRCLDPTPGTEFLGSIEALL